MHDVFISYSSQDKAVADATCARLEAAGIRCWIAPRDILPGMDWGGSIIEAIEGARLMVLILSASADGSPQILREVERAVNKGLRLIPLRIQDIKPGKNLEYFLGTPHWLDAITPPLDKHLEYLVQTAKTLLEQEGDHPKEAVIQPPPAVPPTPLAQRKVLIGAGAAIGLLILVTLFWLIHSRSPLSQFVGAWTTSNSNGPGRTYFTLEIARDGSYMYQADYREAGQSTLRNGRLYLSKDAAFERSAGPVASGSKPPAPANIAAAISPEVWALIGRFCGVAPQAPDSNPFRLVPESHPPTPGAVPLPSVWEWYPTFGNMVWHLRFEFKPDGNYSFSAITVDVGQFTADKGIWSANSSVLQTTTGGKYWFVGAKSMVMTGTVRGAMQTSGNGQTLWERTESIALAQITPRAFPSEAATPAVAAAEASASSSASPSSRATPSMITIDKHFIVTHQSPVYAQPDVSSSIIGDVRRRRKVHAIGFLGNWLKIEMANGNSGFIPVSAVE
ncbi:MAG TPA: toll/interleukin-1 receptor domain-containing protein [Candidatus Binataceae bacterium]|nr:toll/interleukin-1 receptor domain-containing protein [Candidatus Binataceae bacterium]